MNWVDVWKGYHFNYTRILEDLGALKNFDVVMMSGHPSHIADIITIARFLKDTDTVSMFYPEGSTQLYDNSINGFQKIYYDAWRACDILSSAEEDKVSYYKSFVTPETIVSFIHVPLRAEMENGRFMVDRVQKGQNLSVVYGDNNPNHPLIAIACSAKLGLDVIVVDVDRDGKLAEIKSLFPNIGFKSTSKLSQYSYLRLLGRSGVHFYPTEWIGTARENISCAITGTPCIGSRESHTQRRLYPEWLWFSPYDISGMTEAAKRLLLNVSEYEEVAENAFKEAQFYNLANTKQRFYKAVQRAQFSKQARKATVSV
jgi:glycosyltransferase involved in cell wall biosynthesis